MTPNTVDALAKYPHYYDHIKPVWDELERRGNKGIFYVSPSTHRPGRPTRGLPRSDRLLIVAGYPDLSRTRRPVVFIEHGIGENYGKDDPHYSGGRNRERVQLFLCPNERVKAANDEKYPGLSVVVGSPRLESLAATRCDGKVTAGDSRDGRLRVAVSFHWNCRLHPQAGTALHEYQPYFSSWNADSRIELVGHAHPRQSQAERFYAAAGIPFQPSFDRIVEWADVYAVDNSSTLFEASAVGIPVVVMDSIHYTPEETGFRFWKYADIGPRIRPGESLGDAAIHAFERRNVYDDLQSQMVAEVFGTVEGSTSRAVDAIEHHVNTSGSTSAADPGTYPAQPSLFST